MSEITLEQIEGIEKRIAYYKELYNGYLEGAWEAEPLEQICKLARQALSQGDVVWEGKAQVSSDAFSWPRISPDGYDCLDALRPFQHPDKKVHVTIRRPK